MKLLLVFIITVCVHAVKAQDTSFAIKGKLVSDTSAKLDDIAIQLVKADDRKLVKLELSNVNGIFTFEKIPPGEYLILTESLNFSPYKSATVKLDQNIDLGIIVLEALDNTLKGVTVTAAKPFIQQEYDRTVINVASSITSVGNTALEVLQKAPGISLDQNDNISMRGRQGVLIMIDGKITQMTGQDLANMLRSMQADQIDKIDLITNPSAKFDAAGNAGIIDIKLKKGKTKGTNGTVSLNIGQGVYSKLNPSFNFNRRAKKVNVFGAYNYGNNTNFSRLDIFRDFYAADDQYSGSNNYNNRFKFQAVNHTVRLGADFNFGRNIVIGLVANGVFNSNDVSSNSVANTYNSQRQNTGYFQTNGNTNPYRGNSNLNLNYKQILDSTGKELTADVDYAIFESDAIQNYLTSYFDVNSSPALDPFKLKGDLSGNLNIKSFKVDYQQPIKSLGAKLEVGIKSSWVESDNDVKFFNQSSGSDILDEAISNRFIYQENINAAYLNGSKSWKKLSLQLGLRLENTIAKGLQVIGQNGFDRNYTQLFPSGYMGYKFNKKNDIGISLSRRINRPSYRQLNPFKVFLDPLTYSTGNPFLNPELTNSLEFTYSFDKKYIAKIGYSRTTDNILLVLSPDTDPGTVIQTDRNLAQFDYYNVSVGFPVTIGKWLKSNFNALMFYGNYTGNLANTNLNDGRVTFNFNSNNTVVISKNLTAEVNAFYNTKSLYGFLYIDDVWSLSLGIQKQILNKKASVRLNVADVLYSNKINGTTRLTGYGEEFFQRRDTRVATLSFTYKFGKLQSQKPARKTGGAEEEKRRAG